METYIIVLIVLISFLVGYKLFNSYKKENMKVIQSDEKEIRKQELSEVEKELSQSGEQNVLSEEEKDLGQTSQPLPEI